MNRQLAARNSMVDWQVAPPDYRIATYDEDKFTYRRYVEEMIRSLADKNAKKKTFVTISTNVMCAEVGSKNSTLDPINRDIYQPLEIALSKWTMKDLSKEREKRSITTKVWIINPGEPSDRLADVDHKVTHKIDYKKLSGNDAYVENDMQKVFEEINAFLTTDRVVFSDTLRNCRQDLGCLKWLNRAVNYKMKPIKVFSVEDLYVVLLRHICPNDIPSSSRDFLCPGVARFRFDSTTNNYDLSAQCQYHRDLPKEDEGEECGCCARLIAESWGHVIMDDAKILLDLAELSADPGEDAGEDLAANMGGLNLSENCSTQD